MKAFDKASLALVPDGIKDGKLYSIKPTDGSGDFTFTRGSNLAATRVDENGLIEKGRENLLLQSNQFDTTWAGSGTWTATSGQAGYDGSNDAWLLADTAGNGNSFRQTISNTGVLTFSAYFKAGSIDGVRIRILASPSDLDTWWNLADSSTGPYAGDSGMIDRKKEILTNGWVRVSITFSASSTSSIRIYSDDGSTQNFTIGNFYIQDAQLEQGLVATDYIETGATTAQAGVLEDLPRIDYTDGTPSLLLEPSRTNFIPNSEYANGGSVSSATITDNVTISPEGVQNAARFVPTAGFGRWESATFGGSITNGTTYVTSMYFNTGSTLDIVTFYIGWNGATGADRIGIKFNPSTRAYISTFTFGSATLTDYNISEADSNGWYRVSLIAPATNPNVSTQIVLRDFDILANSSDFVDFYGAQVEQGSYATSYIPTYGTAATRSSDYYSNTSVSNIGSTDKCTFYCEIDLPQEREGSSYFLRFDGPTSSFALKGNSVTSTIIQVNGTGNITSSSTITLSAGVHKLIVRWENGVGSIFIDGVKKTEQVTSSTTEVFDEFRSRGSDYRHLQKSILVFPEALSDAECIRLTTENLTLTKPAFVGGAGLNNFIVAVSGDIAGGSGTIETNWQWQISNDGNTWADVNGATNDYYTIPNNTNLLGKYIRVEQSINDEYGTLTVVASDGQQILQLAGLFDSVPGTAGYSLNRLRSTTPFAAAARVTRDGTHFTTIGFTSDNLFDSAAAMAYATQTGNIAQYFFDEEFDINTFGRYGGEIDALVTPFRGEENVLVYEVANDAIDAQRYFAKNTFDPTLGHTIRVQAKVLLPSNQKVDKVRIWTGYGPDGFIDVTTTDVWVDVNQTLVVASGTNIRVQAYIDTNLSFYAPGDKFYIKDLIITDTTPNLHVQTLYDQSGNNNHAVQNAFQSMPMIIKDGVLVEENGKAAIDFDGVDDELILSDVSARSFYAVLSSVDGGDFVSTTQNRLVFNSSTFDWQEKNFSTSISYTLGNQALLSFNDSTSGIFSLNGVTHTNTDANPYNQGSEVFNRIGANDSGSPLIEGTIQEFILFNSDQSKIREGIERVMANRYNIDLS